MDKALLGLEHLKVVQNRNQAFNLDSVLLAHFIQIPARAKKILDVGTGTGVLMLYMSHKTKAMIHGIEIQSSRYENACKSIQKNQLETRLKVILGDYKMYTEDNYDVIISNPPFFKVTEAKQNIDEETRIARHEIHLDLESLIQKTSVLLKNGGLFYMVYRPDRLEEVIYYLNQYQMTLKRICMVHPYLNKGANHVLICASKRGQHGLVVDPPIIIYQDKHQLTEEMKRIYGGI